MNTSIYDFNEREILENATKMCRQDVEKCLSKKSFIIFSINDFIEHLQGNNALEETLNGRTLEQFKVDLKSGIAPEDHDSGVYADCDYVIEYIL